MGRYTLNSSRLKKRILSPIEKDLNERKEIRTITMMKTVWVGDFVTLVDVEAIPSEHLS